MVKQNRLTDIFRTFIFYLRFKGREGTQCIKREQVQKVIIIVIIISIVNNNSNGNELVDWGNNWAISPLYNGYRAGRRFEPNVHKLRMGREFTSLRGNNER